VSILSEFEDRVGRAVEGVFSGVFKAPVQPAELARAAAKEMDKRRRLGVGKVYVPSMYSVLLSPEDGDQLGGFTLTLAGELETYLIGHAHERAYELPHKPRVRFLVDEELRLGRFEVIGEFLTPAEIQAELGGADDRASADSALEPIADPEPITGLEPDPSPPTLATITVPGIEHDVALTGGRMVIGRLKHCDIRLDDANVSREHAALEHQDAGWAIVDLGSLNGTLLNGERVGSALLRDRDVIAVGISELVYHEPGGDTP
jgi:hypothetical protein